jgi:hypothetical protein
MIIAGDKMETVDDRTLFKNKLKYLKKPYTIKSYNEIIQILLKEGYAFKSFALKQISGKTIFLRHDIDYSLNWAEKLAKINNQLGAKGTFFFQLRSGMYNLFSFDGLKILRKIIDYGQYIGFHLTLSSEQDTYEKINLLLKHDFNVFKSLVPECEAVFAWHNPGIAFINDKQLMERNFKGFVNAYGHFANGKYPYYADSNMRYEVMEILDIIKSGEKVFQLALAPMQWISGHNNMASILISTISQKLKDMDSEFMTNYVFKEIFRDGIPHSALNEFEKILSDLWKRR